MGQDELARRRRGRPRSEGPYNVKRDAPGNIVDVRIAQSANFDALAFQVAERRDAAKAAGKKMTIKKAVEEEITLAIQRNNDWPEELRPASWEIVREGRKSEFLANALREVRRRLSKEAGGSG